MATSSDALIKCVETLPSSSSQDPVLGLLIDGVAIDCSGAFTATSYLTSLSVGLWANEEVG